MACENPSLGPETAHISRPSQFQELISIYWLRRAGRHQRVVFLLRLTRQQHPQRVHADRGAEWNIEKRDECQDEGEHASPGVVLHQSPSGYKSACGLAQDENSQNREERAKETCGNVWRHLVHLMEMRE